MAWLDKYRDFEVEVLYLVENNMYSDKGRITDFGDMWVELRKAGKSGELFLIPLTAIRLMKVISSPQEGAENRLLRPAMPVENDQAKLEERR